MLKKVLKKIKYIVADMDGTINLGDNPIGDMANTLNTLREKGMQIVYLTNNSSNSVQSVTEKYKRIGLYDQRDVFYTAGSMTIEYIQKNYPNKTCYVVGTPALIKEFEDNGITVTEENPDIVVLGLDTTMTYDKLVKLISAVKHGAIYIATHPDLCCPAEDVYIPDCGAFIKLIELASGYKPVAVIGKPNTYMGDEVLKRFNCNADEVLMVGDRLTTDIQHGINCGFYTMAVLTGETTEKILKASDIKPDFTLENFNLIVDYLE